MARRKGPVVGPRTRDPFDRLLVAQALIEDMATVSKDEILSAYGVTVLW